MPSNLSEHIPSSEVSRESPEVRRLLESVSFLSKEVSRKLKWEKWLTLPAEEIEKKILSIVWPILQNSDIRKNPTVLSLVEKHIHDFLERITLLDTQKLELYQTQKWLFEDVGYERSTKFSTDTQKHTILLSEIFTQGISSLLTPQMRLLERAFQRRALQYDYENFSQFQASMAKGDTFLPQGVSALDFVLEKSNGGKRDLSKISTLDEEGMMYIIDSLNPPGKTWLKEMVKNGNLTPASRQKWYTDAQVSGKTIDTVALLLQFQSDTRSFQSKEIELSSLRAIAFWKTPSRSLPFESKNYPEIAPQHELYEEGIFEAIAKVQSWDECIRLIGKLLGLLVSGDMFVSGISWVDFFGRVLRKGERAETVILGWIKAIALTILLGKLFTMTAAGLWKMTAAQRLWVMSIARRWWK